jgi:electron transport complex protein RnfG
MYNHKITPFRIGLIIIFVWFLSALTQAVAQEETALKSLMPQANNFKPLLSGEDIIYYKAYDKSGSPIGVIFKAKTKGYSGDIVALAAMDSDGKILAVKILSQFETSGLGARIEEESFLGQFQNKICDDLYKVEAISGATISSKAVIDSVANKAQEIRELLKNRKRE